MAFQFRPRPAVRATCLPVVRQGSLLPSGLESTFRVSLKLHKQMAIQDTAVSLSLSKCHQKIFYVQKKL